MTPKEKAIELVDKYLDLDFEIYFEDATQCALTAVDELIYSHSQDTTDNQYYFWENVKQEIEKL